MTEDLCDQHTNLFRSWSFPTSDSFPLYSSFYTIPHWNRARTSLRGPDRVRCSLNGTSPPLLDLVKRSTGKTHDGVFVYIQGSVTGVGTHGRPSYSVELPSEDLPLSTTDNPQLHNFYISVGYHYTRVRDFVWQTIYRVRFIEIR